jgi:ATP-dependent Clp protease adaptor protein ClpS
MREGELAMGMNEQSQAAVATPEIEAPAADPRERTKPKRQPPYAVILHNDDLNGMDFVVGVLRKVFKFGRLHAVWLMLKAHVSGRVIVWTGSLEVAELKAEQLKSCGADPLMKAHGATTLSVSIEPLPQ